MPPYIVQLYVARRTRSSQTLPAQTLSMGRCLEAIDTEREEDTKIESRERERDRNRERESEGARRRGRRSNAIKGHHDAGQRE